MRLGLVVLALVSSTPVSAEVVSASEDGFQTMRTATVKVPPDAVYAALGKVGQWWSPAHTHSGDASNMTIKLQAGACFCETLPKTKGSVEHGRVIFADPARMLRLQAALGPLQAEAVTGVLTWTLMAKEGGTEIRQRYAVGGAFPGGMKAIAPAVDAVLDEQLARLVSFAAKSKR